MKHTTLEALRNALLPLHRAMLEAERRELERAEGRLSAADFLQRVLHDEALAWLRPFGAVLVRLDEALEDPAVDAAPVLAQVRALLRADPEGTHAQRRYAALLQRSPEVLFAHGALGG